MSDDQLLAHTVRLTSSLDALAALAAFARVESEQLDVEPDVRRLLSEIAADILGDAGPITPAGAAPAVGMARAFLRTAIDTVEHPGRRGEWSEVDPMLLQGVGRLSGAIAGAVRAAEGELDGLALRLASPGATIVDVGTGTGWLAIALARAYPSARIIGLDVYPTALELARANVAAEGLDDRVELRLLDVRALSDSTGFDVIWLPLPFLPRDVVPVAIAAACRALVAGGWLMPGTFAGPPDRLSQLLLDLRTVRSGGHPWRPDEIVTMLSDAGLGDVREVTRTWAAPVRLYAARRP